jgi:hypothetical protein
MFVCANEEDICLHTPQRCLEYSPQRVMEMERGPAKNPAWFSLSRYVAPLFARLIFVNVARVVLDKFNGKSLNFICWKDEHKILRNGTDDTIFVEVRIFLIDANIKMRFELVSTISSPPSVQWRWRWWACIISNHKVVFTQLCILNEVKSPTKIKSPS